MPIAFTENDPCLSKQQILHHEHIINSNMILSCAHHSLCLDRSIINYFTPGLPWGLKRKKKFFLQANNLTKPVNRLNQIEWDVNHRTVKVIKKDTETRHFKREHWSVIFSEYHISLIKVSLPLSPPSLAFTQQA